MRASDDPPLRFRVGVQLTSMNATNRIPSMKATFDLPEDLLRRAETEAAARGARLQDLLIDGLLQVLEQPAPTVVRPTPLPSRFSDGCGIVRTGVGDLSCNPDHLRSFGRD